jgi:mono/diheme cytochrome c family protein
VSVPSLLFGLIILHTVSWAQLAVEDANDSLAVVEVGASAQDTSAAQLENQLSEPLQAAAELYIVKCRSCHTIGDGPLVGPDLKGAHERRNPSWLIQMIQTPSSMLTSDPDARALLTEYKNVRMPDLGLNDDQVASLVDLITYCSVEQCDLKGKFVPVAEATEDDVRRGIGLFTGRIAQESGGPPCISCHAVSGTDVMIVGGSLAVDLTNVFARMGDEGLDASLRNPSFALMNKIFADRALSAEEVLALRAFLYQANRNGLSEIVEPVDPYSVPLTGVLGTVLALVLLNAAWSRRLKGADETRPNRMEP